MSNNVIIFREQNVTLFRLPNVLVTQGHYLDSWKDKIWRGNLFLKTNPDFLTIELLNDDGTLYAKSYTKEDYQNYVQKCIDSSRGYAIKLTHDDNRFAWVGMVFHDRTSAFQFFVTFQDHLNRKKQKFKKIEVDPNMNFKLQKGQKIQISFNNPDNNNPDDNWDDFGDFNEDNKEEKKNIYFAKNNLNQIPSQDFNNKPQDDFLNFQPKNNQINNEKNINKNELSNFKLNIGIGKNKDKKNIEKNNNNDFLNFGKFDSDSNADFLKF
jgi:hypothetical protein